MEFSKLLATIAIALIIRAVAGAPQMASRAATTIVDLDYVLQQGRLEATGMFYNFTNIRYAAPPVGDLRFRKPVPPAMNRSAVQDGGEKRICPQAYPSWEDTASSFVLNYLLGQLFDPSSQPKVDSDPPPPEPAETEDCLFLDVFVPQKVFDQRRAGNGAPVLVWIFGGAYVGGDKAGRGSPAGLLERSNNEIVFVQINYRLGALGWMGGSSVQEDGEANAGLWDQRLALQWIQKHIKSFGGDPSRVTVMGESSGGGSVMHQITAFGGAVHERLFSQAIAQSPGFVPIVRDEQGNRVLSDFLREAGVSSLSEARQMSSASIMAANARQIWRAPYGNFLYGPYVDGNLVPKLPAELLASGRFDRQVRVLNGHNSNEALIFTNPNSYQESTYVPNLKLSLPSMADEDVEFVASTLYPPLFNGTQGYRDGVMRQATTAADLAFLCNSYALAKFTAGSYMYEFDIYPGLHGLDVAYTFYTGPGSPVAATKSIADRAAQWLGRKEKRQEPYRLAAVAMQEWITSFVKTGKPSSSLGPDFEPYGKHQKILKLVEDKYPPQSTVDDIVAGRCDAWIHFLEPRL